jgi:hypothetical protein
MMVYAGRFGVEGLQHTSKARKTHCRVVVAQRWQEIRSEIIGHGTVRVVSDNDLRGDRRKRNGM